MDLKLSQVDRSGTASTFQSYATNITNTETANIETSGGLVTEQLSNPDGTSLLRKEDDGTVHIGQNSIVLRMNWSAPVVAMKSLQRGAAIGRHRYPPRVIKGD